MLKILRDFPGAIWTGGDFEPGGQARPLSKSHSPSRCTPARALLTGFVDELKREEGRSPSSLALLIGLVIF